MLLIRYIKGTLDAILCFGGSNFIFRGYDDLDFVRHLHKRKYIMGYMFNLAGGGVSLVIQIMECYSFTVEAEYMTIN